MTKANMLNYFLDHFIHDCSSLQIQLLVIAALEIFTKLCLPLTISLTVLRCLTCIRLF